MTTQKKRAGRTGALFDTYFVLRVRAASQDRAGVLVRTVTCVRAARWTTFEADAQFLIAKVRVMAVPWRRNADRSDWACMIEPAISNVYASCDAITDLAGTSRVVESASVVIAVERIYAIADRRRIANRARSVACRKRRGDRR